MGGYHKICEGILAANKACHDAQTCKELARICQSKQGKQLYKRGYLKHLTIALITMDRVLVADEIYRSAENA